MSSQFQRRDDRANTISDTVNRVERQRWKCLLLRFQLRQVRQAPKGWHELSSSSEERGISTTFVGWLLCDFNCCAKTAKTCRKNTNNGGWTIHRIETKVAKNKRFPLTRCWVRRLEGAWSFLKSRSMPSRTRNWIEMRANCGYSTATAVDLRAVLRRWANFLHALDISKNNRHIPVFYPSRCTFRTDVDTRMCSPLEKQAATSQSLDRFRFHRTELQLQLCLFHPPYCTPLLVVDSTEWLHCFVKQKKLGKTKSSPENDEEVLQLSEVIIRRLKWSANASWDDAAGKCPDFSKSSKNHLSPRSLPSR